MMKGLSATVRIALSLAGLTVSLLLGAHLLGLIPDERAAIMRGRSALCEAVAINFSSMAEQNAVRAMSGSLRGIQQRNPDIVSVGIRRADGEFLVQAGDHAAQWQAPPTGRSTETHMFTFVVNATPILDGTGSHRGVLASFENVTDLERNRAQLSQTLAKLRESSDAIQQQNKELERLATRDPLTGCFNRRSFFEQFESQWSSARRYDYPLSRVMLDIDHFKSVNDTFGHRAGDQVLQQVAQALKSTAREGDVVCRYGGEEFAVLLPHIDVDDAVRAAERLRAAIAALQFPNMTVTASLGVAAISQGAHDPQALLEQADKCLYLAKRNGRDQVVRWDDIPEGMEFDAADSPRVPADQEGPAIDCIPFQAVTALISALAYRDLETAEHSRRVADLCVATAEGLMSLRDCYHLETAALLHDIGKVGVPDSILLKPGPLTGDEWKVMQRHDRVGVEIIEASFGADKLTAIVANHGAHYGDSDPDSTAPRGTDIPLGARILGIADAYDSMVTDHVYRQGRSHQEAIAELRRCSGSQFDPELVERFAQTVDERRDLNDIAVRNVSKRAAANIGQQIGRLVAALDSRDTTGLQALAGRLKSTATRHGIVEIADKAQELDTALDSNADCIDMLKAAYELIDLCRATQHAYLAETHAQPLATVS